MRCILTRLKYEKITKAEVAVTQSLLFFERKPQRSSVGKPLKYAPFQ